jgi:hypothetical protein
MGKFTNSYVLGQILRSVYHVSGRRTTQSFAAKVVGSIIKTLEQRYDFLSYITIQDKELITEQEVIKIDTEIDNINRDQI